MSFQARLGREVRSLEPAFRTQAKSKGGRGALEELIKHQLPFDHKSPEGAGWGRQTCPPSGSGARIVDKSSLGMSKTSTTMHASVVRPHPEQGQICRLKISRIGLDRLIKAGRARCAAPSASISLGAESQPSGV